MIEFDSRGEYTPLIKQNPVTPDGSHPEEWKGHFVIVQNDVAKDVNTREDIQFHRDVIRRSNRAGKTYVTTYGSFPASFNPTVFDTYERAYDALRTFVKMDVRPYWCNVLNLKTETNPLKLVRGTEYDDGTVVRRVDPMFEIVDAFEYRISKPSDVRGKKRKVEKKENAKNAAKPPTTSHWNTRGCFMPTDKRAEAQKYENDCRENWLRYCASHGITGKGGVSPESKKKKDRNSMWFVVKDNKTGKYLYIPSGGDLARATLTDDVSHATYCTSYDKLIGLMNTIERMFWIEDFRDWHLVTTTVIVDPAGNVLKVNT